MKSMEIEKLKLLILLPHHLKLPKKLLPKN